MEDAVHIPTYLLCERFAANGRVLDLLPRDLAGSRLLASSAGMVVSVERTRIRDRDAGEPLNLYRMVAAADALPFGRGAFDLVVVSLVGSAAGVEVIDERVRAVRGLLSPGGLLAVLVPNRDGIALLDDGMPEAPDFLDFERALRRHFPHVVLLAQQPLHGAVLSPIGRRRSRDGPLLDERLLSEGGEAPVCFLALCSPRYRKVDETLVARLPFAEFAAGIRARLERLNGTIDLMRHEQEAQRAASSVLEQRCVELRSRLDAALLDSRDKAAVEVRVAELEEALGRRDQALEEGDRVREELRRRADGQEQELQAAGHESRRLERRIQVAQQAAELAAREREEQERELDRVRVELREARAEAKAKQRELDDALEQLAGTEAELDALLKDATRQRRELMTARERSRGLEQELREKVSDGARIQELERDLEELRQAAATERERLEGRIEEQGRRVVEVAAGRDAALQGARESRHELDAVIREREEAAGRIVDLERRRLDTAFAAEERIARLSEQLGESEARAAEDREELERLRPRATTVEAVRELARTAEARAEELHGELERARMEVSELRSLLDERERELAEAREALAEHEGARAERRPEDDDRIRELKKENLRLRQENESELVRVREDLESELRSVRRQLETRDQEIWELREETVRLRAHNAAAVAAGEGHDQAAGIHRTVFEQENTIAELHEECRQLRAECEKRQRSLDVRKKNLRILAALLRQERAGRREGDTDPPPPAEDRGEIAAADAPDIAGLIEGAMEEFDEVDEALETVRVSAADPDDDPRGGS